MRDLGLGVEEFRFLAQTLMNGTSMEIVLEMAEKFWNRGGD